MLKKYGRFVSCTEFAVLNKTILQLLHVEQYKDDRIFGNSKVQIESLFTDDADGKRYDTNVTLKDDDKIKPISISATTKTPITMDIIIPYIKKNMKDEGLLFNEKVISYDIADEKDDDSFYYTKPMVCGSDFVCNTSKYNIIVDSGDYITVYNKAALEQHSLKEIQCIYYIYDSSVVSVNLGPKRDDTSYTIMEFVNGKWKTYESSTIQHQFDICPYINMISYLVDNFEVDGKKIDIEYDEFGLISKGGNSRYECVYKLNDKGEKVIDYIISLHPMFLNQFYNKHHLSTTDTYLWCQDQIIISDDDIIFITRYISELNYEENDKLNKEIKNNESVNNPILSITEIEDYITQEKYEEFFGNSIVTVFGIKWNDRTGIFNSKDNAELTKQLELEIKGQMATTVRDYLCTIYGAEEINNINFESLINFNLKSDNAIIGFNANKEPYYELEFYFDGEKFKDKKFVLYNEFDKFSKLCFHKASIYETE